MTINFYVDCETKMAITEENIFNLKADDNVSNA
jgi:hypothetical protein